MVCYDSVIVYPHFYLFANWSVLSHGNVVYQKIFIYPFSIFLLNRGAFNLSRETYMRNDCKSFANTSPDPVATAEPQATGSPILAISIPFTKTLGEPAARTEPWHVTQQ